MEKSKQIQFPNVKEEAVCNTNALNCMDKRIHQTSKNNMAVNKEYIDLGSSTQMKYYLSKLKMFIVTMNSQITKFSIVFG